MQNPKPTLAILTLYLYVMIFTLPHVDCFQSIPIVSFDSQYTTIQSSILLSPRISANDLPINFTFPQHFIYFYIGTPSQRIRVMFDTGSSILLVPQIYCQTCFCQNKFDPNMSSTFQKTGKQFSTSFLDQTRMSGYKAFEMVSLGHPGEASNMEISLIQKQTQSIYSKNYTGTGPRFMFDGIMGMGNDKRILNILDILYKNNQLISPIFAFELGSELFDQSSTFYYNFSKQDFPAIYTSTINNSSWTLKVQEFYMDGYYFNIKYCEVDTGSTAIIMPASQFNSLYEKILAGRCQKQNNQYFCDCKNLAYYPNILLKLKNNLIKVTPYIYLLYTDRYYYDECKLLLTPMNVDIIILGMAFLNHYTVIFNKLQNEIGFIQRLHQTTFYTKNQDYFILIKVFTYILGLLALFIVLSQVIFKRRSQLIRIEMIREHIEQVSPNIQMQGPHFEQNSRSNEVTP